MFSGKSGGSDFDSLILNLIYKKYKFLNENESFNDIMINVELLKVLLNQLQIILHKLIFPKIYKL